MTKVEALQGEPCPVRRGGHAACCLNYGKDHPQLLVFGGRSNDGKTLSDMWLLDVDTGKWTEVRVIPAECAQFGIENEQILWVYGRSKLDPVTDPTLLLWLAIG